MGKKLTLEFIKEEYSKRNYEFLDDSYVGALHKHNIKCSTCNHAWKQHYNSLQQGRGCPRCARNIQHTLEFVKEEYSKNNYQFLDDFYKNANYKHNIKCLTCGHIWKQVYGHFQQGKGCPKCVGKLRHTLDFIKQEYSKRNYEFLDDLYESTKHLHNIKCLTCGYEWKQSYNTLQQNHGCPKCADIKSSEQQKHTLEFVKQEYDEKGYEFLDEFYNNSSYKHNIKCNTCDYEWKQRYNSLQHGSNCPKCSKNQYKQTCLKKHGSYNPMQNSKIALKNARSQTNTYIRHHFLTNEELTCQGSWEARVVDFLNTSKINYLWQPKTFTLNTGKTYRPDLYLVDLDLWIEIKGWMRPVAKKKWDEFHTQIQPNSELWDKKKLKQLGIDLLKKI